MHEFSSPTGQGWKHDHMSLLFFIGQHDSSMWHCSIDKIDSSNKTVSNRVTCMSRWVTFSCTKLTRLCVHPDWEFPWNFALWFEYIAIANRNAYRLTHWTMRLIWWDKACISCRPPCISCPCGRGLPTITWPPSSLKWTMFAASGLACLLCDPTFHHSIQAIHPWQVSFLLVQLLALQFVACLLLCKRPSSSIKILQGFQNQGLELMWVIRAQ